jgi:hypothetical protein
MKAAILGPRGLEAFALLAARTHFGKIVVNVAP